MKQKTVIYLLSVSTTENDIGDTIETPITRKILADKKSVRQSEFYQSKMTGLRPEFVFEIWTHEYRQESQLKYKGKNYTIIRTFDKDERRIELVCEGLVNQNASS